MKNLFFILFLISFGFALNIDVFYSNGCPHCAHLISFLNSLNTKNCSNLSINYYEVHDKTNMNYFYEKCGEFNTTPKGVPTTFINDKMLIGDSYENEKYLKSEISKYCNIEKKDSLIDLIKNNLSYILIIFVATGIFILYFSKKGEKYGH